MRTVRLRLHVPDKPASDVYQTLADFERYPELSDAVRSVAVTEVSENRHRVAVGGHLPGRPAALDRTGHVRPRRPEHHVPPARGRRRRLRRLVAVRRCRAGQRDRVLRAARHGHPEPRRRAGADRGAHADRQHRLDRARAGRQRRTRRVRRGGPRRGARHEPAARRAGHPGRLSSRGWTSTSARFRCSSWSSPAAARCRNSASWAARPCWSRPSTRARERACWTRCASSARWAAGRRRWPWPRPCTTSRSPPWSS